MNRIALFTTICLVFGMAGVANAQFGDLGDIEGADFATMLDGTILTRKQPIEPFATEGPMWDVDVAAQTITVVGKTLTFPLTLHGATYAITGEELFINGSSVLSNDGEAHIGISAQNFDRLLDVNAVSRDSAPHHPFNTQTGPPRSVFSTMESKLRDGTSHAEIEQNYFDYLQSCYAVHAALLPADFLAKAGVRGTKKNPELVYPPTTGGTLKSAGHVYLDSMGNEHFVTDIEAVIELSENVTLGPIRSMDPGDPTTGRPASFLVEDLLVIFNQDPRFGADVLGLGETVIPNDLFFVPSMLGVQIDIIGHTVGEHVLFAQELLTELVDPTAPIVIAAERWRFRDDSNEVRIRGVVDRPQGLTVTVTMDDGNPLTQSVFPIPLVVDPVTPGANFSFRSRGDVSVAAISEVTITGRLDGADATAAPAFEETFLRSEVEE